MKQIIGTVVTAWAISWTAATAFGDNDNTIGMNESVHEESYWETSRGRTYWICQAYGHGFEPHLRAHRGAAWMRHQAAQDAMSHCRAYHRFCTLSTCRQYRS